MSHSDPIIRRLFACVLARVPACMWGPPGTGKTARAASLQHALDVHGERWLLSRCEPIDLKPRVYHEGKIIVAKPPEIERLSSAPARDHLNALRGILFLDEFNRSARETEGAALDIVDNPPDGVAVLAACNPPSKGQAARSLESAAANRFCHLDVEADANAWATAQVAGWNGLKEELKVPSADAMTKAEAKARTYVSAFIRRKANLLEVPPDNPVAAGKAWPSTRTWEMARKLHAVCMALSYDAEDTRILIAGCVGEGVAIEFMTFIQDADLPDPEDLLKDPARYSPPKGRVDKTVTALTGVAGALETKLDDTRWRASWVLVQRCLDADQADAAIVGADMFLASYNRRKRSGDVSGLTLPQKLMPNRMAQLLVGS